MANGYMYLKCSKCEPGLTEENRKYKDRILIAKYYPSTGWYFFLPSLRATKLTSLDIQNPEKLNLQLKADAQTLEDRENDFNKFFEDHSHINNEEEFNSGNQNFIIHFEY